MLFKKKSWTIQTPVDCFTRNCIYAVTCQKAGETGSTYGLECQYIALITRRETKRWGSIKPAKPLIQATSKQVGIHFSRKYHEIHDMSFVVIEEVKSKNPFILKARESYCIQQYDSVNHGLNISE